jgi:hypothetical protein
MVQPFLYRDYQIDRQSHNCEEVQRDLKYLQERGRMIIKVEVPTRQTNAYFIHHCSGLISHDEMKVIGIN